MSRHITAERAALESRRVERVYAALAGVYDGFFGWALGPGRRRAISRLGLSTGESVLEVGVGTGLSFPHYPGDARITGIDISAPMLAQARERAGVLGREVDLRLMDARELAFGDATFDHVLAPYVISVVAEPERVMQEIRRVCRPGGTVIVVNHFGSRLPVLRTLNKTLTPLSQWLGFRLDVPIDIVTKVDELRVIDVERVNLLGLWQLVRLERT